MSTEHLMAVRDALQPPAWMADALCAEVGDGDMWFPAQGGTNRPAKNICARCDVAETCLQHALDNDIRQGVWGGLSERERRRLRHRRRGGAGVAA